MNIKQLTVSPKLDNEIPKDLPSEEVLISDYIKYDGTINLIEARDQKDYKYIEIKPRLRVVAEKAGEAKNTIVLKESLDKGVYSEEKIIGIQNGYILILKETYQKKALKSDQAGKLITLEKIEKV